MHDPTQDPGHEGLNQLSPAERELEGALRTLAPAAPRVSLEHAAFAAGRASMARRVRIWQVAAAFSLILCAGVLSSPALEPGSLGPSTVNLAERQPERTAPVRIDPPRDSTALPTRVVLRDPFSALARSAEAERSAPRSLPAAAITPVRIERASDVLPIRAEVAASGLFRSLFNRGVLP